MQDPGISTRPEGTYYRTNPYTGHWYHKYPNIEGYGYDYFKEELDPFGKKYLYENEPPYGEHRWNPMEKDMVGMLGTPGYPEWTPSSGIIPTPTTTQPQGLFDVQTSFPEVTTSITSPTVTPFKTAQEADFGAVPSGSLDVLKEYMSPQYMRSKEISPRTQYAEFKKEEKGGGKEKKESLDALVDRIYGSSQKSIAEQQKFSKAKAITDTLLTAGSMLGQMTAGSPRPVSPAMVTPPTYQSIIPEYKSAIDRSSAGSLAATTKIAQETGRPELMPAYLANVLAYQNKAYSELATKDIEQRNLQSIAVADALSKTDANRYEAQVAYDDMLDKINLKRSEDLAAMSTSLFSTIPNAYMTNQQSLIDAGNKMELYRYYIKEGHKHFSSFEEFMKTFSTGVPTTETTETPREQGIR